MLFFSGLTDNIMSAPPKCKCYESGFLSSWNEVHDGTTTHSAIDMENASLLDVKKRLDTSWAGRWFIESSIDPNAWKFSSNPVGHDCTECDCATKTCTPYQKPRDPNKVSLCGPHGCVDIDKKDFVLDQCYNVDDTINDQPLANFLKGGAFGGECNFWGVQNLPEGYELDAYKINEISGGKWPTGKYSCQDTAEKVTLTAPNCQPGSNCQEIRNNINGFFDGYGDQRRTYCAFKLRKV